MKPLTYTCGNCQARIASQDSRYSKDGKTLLCVDCHSVIYGKRPSHMVMVPNKRDAVMNRPVMICESCRYRFRVRSLDGNRCPNCDSASITRYETDVDKILKEISQLR